MIGSVVLNAQPFNLHLLKFISDGDDNYEVVTYDEINNLPMPTKSKCVVELKEEEVAITTTNAPVDTQTGSDRNKFDKGNRSAYDRERYIKRKASGAVAPAHKGKKSAYDRERYIKRKASSIAIGRPTTARKRAEIDIGHLLLRGSQELMKVYKMDPIVARLHENIKEELRLEMEAAADRKKMMEAEKVKAAVAAKAAAAAAADRQRKKEDNKAKAAADLFN